MFWLVPLHGQEFTRQYFFKHISAEHGYRSTAFNDIIQDKFGFIWFTTRQGGEPGGSNIIRFDGHDFHVFESRYQDSTSIIPTSLVGLHESSDGMIWIASYRGLFAYDRKTNGFHEIPSADPNERPVDVTGIYEDAQQRVWIGGRERVYLYDKINGQLQPLEAPSFGYNWVNWPGVFAFAQVDSNTLLLGSDEGLMQLNVADMEVHNISVSHLDWKSPHVYDLLPAENGWFDVATSDGLWHFHPEKIVLKADSVFNINPQTSVTSLVRDRNGRQWVGTSKGLYVRRQDEIRHFSHDPANAFSLCDDKIHQVLIDRDGLTWIATSNGLDLVDIDGEPFPFYQTTPGYTRKENYVYRVMEDHLGGFWIRQPGQGLVYLEQLGGRRTVILPDRKEPFREFKNTVMTPDHMIWAATNGDGIYIIDPLDRIPRQLMLGDTVMRFANYVELDPVDPDYVWVQTIHGLLHVNRHNLTRKLFDPKTFQPWLDHPMVGRMIRVSNDEAWCSVNRLGWLAMLNPETGEWSMHPGDSLHATGFPFYSVRDFALTDPNTLYAATRAGLVEIHLADETFLLHTPEDLTGLGESNIMSLVVDTDSVLWLTTQHHICKYNQGTFHCFDLRDQAGFFPNNTSARMHDGRLMIGAQNGLYLINPEQFKEMARPPLVYITALDLPFDAKESSELISNVVIPYQQGAIAIQFTALEFLHPENIKYRYRLVGSGAEWSYAGRDRRVTYSGLQPGKYTFEVIASSGNDIWTPTDNAMRLAITIVPPWYRSPLAYALYAILFVGLVYFISRFLVRRRIAAADHARSKEMQQQRAILYENITHELRTPLTVILAIADRIRSGNGSVDPVEIGNEMDIIERNSRQMLQKADELLNVNNIRQVRSLSEKTHVDIIQVLQYHLQAFEALARNKEITFDFDYAREEFFMDCDLHHLAIVLNNLISNAIKYSDHGGVVLVSFEVDTISEVRVSVQNNGRGISTYEIGNVFKRKFRGQGDAVHTSGYGIGLSLVKQAVESMDGEIILESDRSETKFTVRLPVSHDLAVPGGVDSEDPHAGDLAKEDISTILIIEDNNDVADYITQSLGSHYRFVKANNGIEGIMQARQLIPDFVLCDVMMPGQDGYAVCADLKSNLLTAHIPVLLLTAKADDVSRIKGLREGADAYLTKPFLPEELRVRINNLISLRKTLRQPYAESHNGVNVAPPQEEDPLVLKLRGYIEEHILSHEQVEIEAICQFLLISRAQLYRKLKGATGLSPSRFVRKVKLQHAVHLLRSAADMSIQEVSFASGFNDPAYFSRVFSEEFGMPPTEFRAADTGLNDLSKNLDK